MLLWLEMGESPKLLTTARNWEMSMIKLRSLWLAGAAGVLALAIGTPVTHAATVYGLNIYQGNCGGVAANCAAGNATFSTLLTTGASTYQSNNADGSLSFLYSGNSSQSGTIGGFLLSGNGTATLNPSSIASATLSTPGFGNPSTEFIFTGTLSGGSAYNVTSVHDDGIAFYLGGHLLSPSADAQPTSAETTNFMITAAEIALYGTSYALYYVSANGLPEQLTFAVSAVPLPATAWLFGAGLGGMGLLMRRRRGKGTAKLA